MSNISGIYNKVVIIVKEVDEREYVQAWPYELLNNIPYGWQVIDGTKRDKQRICRGASIRNAPCRRA